MKKIFSLLFILLVVVSVSSAQEIPQNFIGGGGSTNSTSSTNSSSGSAGGSAIGKMTNSGYIMIAGFQAGLMSTTYSTGSAVASSVVIDNVLFNGYEKLDDDYVEASPRVLATITSLASTISPEVSYVEVNGTKTYFSGLTSPSGFSGTSFIYDATFSDGDNTFSIVAYDRSGNSETYSRTLKVDIGDISATSVYIFPNPYNPNNGVGKIAYSLNKQDTVSVYIFNAIGQLVYKREYLSGWAGARVGYNEVDFNGVSDFGQTLANDLYFLRIVSGGKPIGRAKIAILK